MSCVKVQRIVNYDEKIDVTSGCGTHPLHLGTALYVSFTLVSGHATELVERPGYQPFNTGYPYVMILCSRLNFHPG